MDSTRTCGRYLFGFVGAPPSGRWVVVCEANRDEGVAPTNTTPVGDGLLALWEPRPRGDGWWSARLIATRASLLQIRPPLGRWVVVCEALSRRGRRSYKYARPQGDGCWSARLYRDEGVAPTDNLMGF
jgi:hypothetical protein